MQVINQSVLDKGFNFEATAFSSYILSSQGLTIAAPAGNHFIEFGRQDGNASTPYIDFHSGATVTDYDNRLIAASGTGTTGQGVLELLTGQFDINGGDSTNTTLLVDAAASQSANIQSWSVNGTKKLGVLPTGRLQTIAGNETTGGGTPLLGTNSPAVTNTAPYKWLRFTTSDGSDGYVPAWK
jgi:hypothetical protein